MEASLIEHNRRGLIHGPDESDEGFLERVKGADVCEKAPSSRLAKKLFDIEADWVTLHYNDRRLRLWEGGCTWVEPEKVTIQLRKAFETQNSYFGYARDEIIAHELVHVVRGSFEEPIFEEILAYQTSPSSFRRFLGPIFRSSKESTFFLGALFLAGICALFQPYVYLGVPLLISAGVLRLLRARRFFKQTQKRLATLVGMEKTLAVMLRLTDREIIRFSKMEKEQIVSYAVKMSRSHLRWQQIRLAYFVKQVEIEK